MIAQLTGQITHLGDRFVVLDVGGVGYKVFTTNDNIASLKKDTQAKFWTHLVVKEDALDLYGFLTQDELAFFELLITVSGIGPKSALATLSLAGLDTLRQSIASGDSSYLTKVSGIGRKSAEKIVMELKDKVSKLGDFLPQKLDVHTDVLSALEALGYSARDAREAIKKIPANLTDTGEKIKSALKYLGK